MVRQDLAGASARNTPQPDDLVLTKTGKTSAQWAKVLARFGAVSKPTTLSVDHLQDKHGVPRAWARTVVTEYLRQHS